MVGEYRYCGGLFRAMTGNRRNSLRLHGYDYASAGAYFVTACTADRLHLFGKIEDAHVMLTRAGNIVSDNWQRVITLRPDAELDEFIVMPDHFHAIVWLNIGAGADRHHIVGAADYPPFAGQAKELERVDAQFQGRRDDSYQHGAQHTRPPGLAARLLRPGDP